MSSLLEILDKRQISYKKTNNPSEILISCTSGEHNDKNESLSYNLDKNLFHCWSCGFSGGSTKFLASIGETTIIDFDSKQPYKIQKLKEKIQRKLEVDSIKLPEDRKMFTDEFRQISVSVYKEFGAFTTNQLGLADYLCIPVYQFGQLKFIEGRLLKDLHNQPKYYRKPANATVSDCLFPLDKIKNTNKVILVEGMFDLLNMWQLGYKNTLCIFGASNFSKKKLELLDRIGITNVDILMDPDIPGQKAAEKIFNMLDSCNIYSRIIKLPDNTDPGELTQKMAERLLK
jgi:DNA primase